MYLQVYVSVDSTGSPVVNDVREQEIDPDGIILVLAAGVECIYKLSTSYWSQ